MANRKQIGHADIIGDKGIALIHRVVLDMGFVWNPTNLEAGIDGYIEIRDDKTGEVSNCIIQVQSKAGASWFKAETDSTFEFLCDERDLKYWMSGNAPVILVVSRPENDEAYWVSIKDYFRDPMQRKSRKVTFNKACDRFDAKCRDRLAALAVPPDSGVYLSATPVTETLTSNLLPLNDYPKRLFRASTKLRSPSQVGDILRKHPNDGLNEWILHDAFIYAFHDLTLEPWTKTCLSATTENLPTDDWAFSDDRNRRYVFVRMIGKCMRELLYRQGVRFCKDKEHYFFRSTHDLTEKKVGGLSVFKAYESKATPGRTAYYRHRAARLRFLRYDQKWYVEITPSYHFTQDGFKISRYFEERLAGIKLLERQNKTHLRQVQLWEQVLRQEHLTLGSPRPRQLSLFGSDEDDSFETPIEPYPHLTFGRLAQFEVDWGVPEKAWLPSGGVADEDDTDFGQRSLFEL